MRICVCVHIRVWGRVRVCVEEWVVRVPMNNYGAVRVYFVLQIKSTFFSASSQ